ncbi:unnamed protein product [Merluccius merluccius]
MGNGLCCSYRGIRIDRDVHLKGSAGALRTKETKQFCGNCGTGSGQRSGRLQYGQTPAPIFEEVAGPALA